MAAPVVLDVRGLRAYLYTRWGVVRAVDGVSFALREGETLGLVGESGCGKTMTGLSLVRLLPEPAGRIVEGQILLEGEDLVTKSESEMRHVRGRRVSMILQDPQTSLNPVFTIGDQIVEALRLHHADGERALAAASLHRGAHGFGAAHGGKRDAATFDRRPAAAASRSAGRLSLRAALRLRRRPLPPRVSAHHAGRARARGRVLEGRAIAEPLIRVENLTKYFPVTRGLLVGRTTGHVKAVDGVSFTIGHQETPGLVGESGCGKTTTSRLLLRLEEPTAGRVLLDGQDVHALRGLELNRYHTRVQAVFQDPWSSLNPRLRIRDTIAEALVVNRRVTRAGKLERVEEVLHQVGLPLSAAARYPHALR